MNTTSPVDANQSEATSSGTAATILAANALRVGFSVWNGADTTLSVLLDNSGTIPTVTATRRTVDIAAGGYWESPFAYQGVVQGIWAGSPTGKAEITEYTG